MVYGSNISVCSVIIWEMAKMLKKAIKASLLRKKIARDKSIIKKVKGRLNSEKVKILTNSVTSSVRRPMGGHAPPLRISPLRLSKIAWDATNPYHLPLPVTTGPYQVARLTKVWTTESGLQTFILGPYVSDAITGGRAEGWENIICVANNSPLGTAMNATNCCQTYRLDVSSLGDGTTLCPSAFTVTVMNGNALQTTSGVVYMGRMNSCPTLANVSRTWQSFTDQFIAYHSPRLLSAGKLALSAVKCSALPSNISAISNFSSISTGSEGNFTWDGTTSGDFENGGFAPIVLSKPSGLTLTIQVTVEFRLRFDPDHIASSTHVHHKAVPDTFWNDAMAAGIAAGHGVYDIAEAGLDVADAVVHA